MSWQPLLGTVWLGSVAFGSAGADFAVAGSQAAAALLSAAGAPPRAQGYVHELLGYIIRVRVGLMVL